MSTFVVVDLLFNWPPEAGARVDTLYLLRYFARRGEALLVTVDMPDAFPRGRIDGDIGVPVVRVPIPPAVRDHHEFCDRLRARIDLERPDRLVIADAWALKPRLVRALAHWRPIVRFYTHEGLCLKGHGHQFRNDAICPINILDRPSARTTDCLPCFRDWKANTQSTVFDRELELADVEDESHLADLAAGLRGARAAIVSNFEMVERLRPHTPLVVRQPMGFDPTTFYPAGPPTTRRFLLFGRAYDYLKGAHVLLAAANRLWKQRRDFTVAFTGRPSRMVADEALAAPYIELLEPVAHDEVPRLIRSSLACVLPALWPEPFPLAGVEAMACGRTIIASAVGGQKELVADRQNGLLVPPNDIARLAAAMAELLDDPPFRERLESGAVETAKAYHWSRLHEDAYGPLLVDD